MPSFIYTLKKGADKEEFKKEIEAKNGKITHEYTLINALAVTFPDDIVQTFDSHAAVETAEADGVVTTQK